MISEELIEARLLRRYKRFLADVEIAGQHQPVTVHCPNPGSMLGVATEGLTIWLRQARNPEAKLKYGWVLSQLASSFVNVDTLMANKLLDEALKAGRLPELAGYRSIKKEQTFQESRFDFFLAEHESQSDCFLEVKSTTLAESGIAMFPDAKTERGRKHLEHLIECKKIGLRAVQFFCVCRSDTNKFMPADHVDKLYAESLRRAAAAGVELLAYSVEISRAGSRFDFELSTPLAVALN